MDIFELHTRAGLNEKLVVQYNMCPVLSCKNSSKQARPVSMRHKSIQGPRCCSEACLECLPCIWVGTLTFEDYLFCRQRKAIGSVMFKWYQVQWYCTVYSLVSPHFHCASRQCFQFCDWSDPETADSLQNTKRHGHRHRQSRKARACVRVHVRAQMQSQRLRPLWGNGLKSLLMWLHMTLGSKLPDKLLPVWGLEINVLKAHRIRIK